MYHAQTKRLSKRLPQLFSFVRGKQPKRGGVQMVVDKATFSLHWDALSCSLFECWPRAMWENVLVAGGAILACCSGSKLY